MANHESRRPKSRRGDREARHHQPGFRGRGHRHRRSWLEFSRRLFEDQPAENGPGLSDDRLVQIAAAGVTGSDIADCIHSGCYAGFVASHSQNAIDAGLTHVPVVKVGDTVLENLTPDGLRAAIERATSAAK
ncbi:DsbA family protein [Nocardia seriolae]|uniref:DSBA oxidoreductase n=1 Tax=Nocardia seriolae TaxID=37332 RepID=A0A0B8NB56_9NOCA|nr:thioredoxin domain-containing protein [Nocardia seriolae]APA97547.1 hypothetical protein NS506_03495 [Nocardia seriolae]MTJ62440.1 hypothetical protein [Nocardia seriolae]MTJ74516.1 hypothetical protein [Nocardia seriolae]MTJ87343.1 hypothetical protein [Nocardia seriolae]MTK31336.1 hypothetical protein [Nocardia seriolae]